MRQLPNNINSGGISSSSYRPLETLLLDKLVVNVNIFDGLEKGYFNTQVFKFS